MDAPERRARQAELLMTELHHQAGLRHSDLQRRFFFALTLAAAVFVSLLRAEVPIWAALAGTPFLAWAWWQARLIDRLSESTHEEAKRIIASIAGEVPEPKDSPPDKENHP